MTSIYLRIYSLLSDSWYDLRLVEVMQQNASILTDRFTSLTADKLSPAPTTAGANMSTGSATDGKNYSSLCPSSSSSAPSTINVKKSFAAFDIISAFEALPERQEAE